MSRARAARGWFGKRDGGQPALEAPPEAGVLAGVEVVDSVLAGAAGALDAESPLEAASPLEAGGMDVVDEGAVEPGVFL